MATAAAVRRVVAADRRGDGVAQGHLRIVVEHLGGSVGGVGRGLHRGVDGLRLGICQRQALDLLGRTARLGLFGLGEPGLVGQQLDGLQVRCVDLGELGLQRPFHPGGVLHRIVLALDGQGLAHAALDLLGGEHRLGGLGRRGRGLGLLLRRLRRGFLRRHRLRLLLRPGRRRDAGFARLRRGDRCRRPLADVGDELTHRLDLRIDQQLVVVARLRRVDDARSDHVGHGLLHVLVALVQFLPLGPDLRNGLVQPDQAVELLDQRGRLVAPGPHLRPAVLHVQRLALERLGAGGRRGIGVGHGARHADIGEQALCLVDVHRADAGIEFDAVGVVDLALAGRGGLLAQLGHELRVVVDQDQRAFLVAERELLDVDEVHSGRTRPQLAQRRLDGGLVVLEVGNVRELVEGRHGGAGRWPKRP